MFESIMKFFKKIKKSEKEDSKNTAKERLHLVLAQDRANISADFLELMKQEILEVIKKYIDIDEKEIDVRLTNKEGEDGSVGAPALYANIPIITIKNEARKLEGDVNKKEKKDNMVTDETSTFKNDDVTDSNDASISDNEIYNNNAVNDKVVNNGNEKIDSGNTDIENNLSSNQPEKNIDDSIAAHDEKSEESIPYEKDTKNSEIGSKIMQTNNDNVNEVEDEKKDS